MSKNFIIPAFIICCNFTTAFPQVVNIEQKRLQKDTTGWVGTIDFNFNYTQNTHEIIQGGNRIQLAYIHNPHRVLLLNDLNIIRADKEDFVNNGFQHIRYNYQLSNLITAEVFTQAQYNAIQKQRLRWLLGTGPRFKILHTDTLRVYIGTLYMYEYEELIDEANINRDHRTSSYLSLGFSPNPKFWFEHITYYQPRIDFFSDFRLTGESVIGINLNPSISIQLRYSIHYNSHPPSEVPNTIQNFKTIIEYKF